MNFKQEFKQYVMDYFVAEYLAGRTPNPCIACNRYVKWESLLARSLNLSLIHIQMCIRDRLCDEPTGALDYNTGKAVLKLLQNTCRKQGKTVIVITHNQALTAMADRVITVKSGTIQKIEKNEHIVDVDEIEWQFMWKRKGLKYEIHDEEKYIS